MVVFDSGRMMLFEIEAGVAGRGKLMNLGGRGEAVLTVI
jgi:hypothetical protein